MISSTESLADLGQRQVREFSTEIHSHLPRGDKRPRAARGTDLFRRDVEIFSPDREDEIRGDARFLFVGQKGVKHALRELGGGLGASERTVGGDPNQGTF